VIQVSFAPVRDGRHAGRLIVTTLPPSGTSARSNPAVQAFIQLTATAVTAAIQVLYYCTFHQSV